MLCFRLVPFRVAHFSMSPCFGYSEKHGPGRSRSMARRHLQYRSNAAVVRLCREIEAAAAGMDVTRTMRVLCIPTGRL